MMCCIDVQSGHKTSFLPPLSAIYFRLTFIYLKFKLTVVYFQQINLDLEVPSTSLVLLRKERILPLTLIYRDSNSARLVVLRFVLFDHALDILSQFFFIY